MSSSISHVNPSDIFTLRPQNAPPGEYLTIGPSIPVEPVRDAPVDLGDRFPWVLTLVSEDVFTVHADRGVNMYKWVIEGNRALYVSAIKPIGIEIIIKPIEGSWLTHYIDVGSDNNRLTYVPRGSGSEPTCVLQPANGSSAQVFEIELFNPNPN